MMGGDGGMGGGYQEWVERRQCPSVRAPTNAMSTQKKSARRKKRQLKKSKGATLFDPYFDIVQVTIYGQARFFNAPPAQPAAEPSPGEVTAAAAPPATAATPAGAPAAPAVPAVAGSPAAKRRADSDSDQPR